MDILIAANLLYQVMVSRDESSRLAISELRNARRGDFLALGIWPILSFIGHLAQREMESLYWGRTGSC
jgi:hypothetical protein